MAQALAVPFAGAGSTQSALDQAEGLSRQLKVHIRVIEVEVVPFTVPIECPPVNVEFLETTLQRLFCTLPIDREIYLTRDPVQT